MLEWFSEQLLVNSEIFKLSLNLSPMHLRANSACYELKGDLSHVILKEIFYDSLKIISKFTRICMGNLLSMQINIYCLMTNQTPVLLVQHAP